MWNMIGSLGSSYFTELADITDISIGQLVIFYKATTLI